MARATLPIIALGAVGVIFGSAAGATIVGDWAMNEVAGSTQMVDAAAPFHHSDPFVGVALNGSKYTFPGWTSNVDAAGALTGALANPAWGEIRITDPTDELMPGSGSFSIRLRLKPTLVAGALPQPGTGANSSPSYNILQRGRSNDVGGFYKLELIGSGSKLGKVVCTMRAPGYSSLTAASASVIDGKSHRVECILDRVAKELRVVTDGVVTGVKSFSTYGAIEPRDVYGHYLTIGKKPGSLTPADAFAGQIDYVLISN